MDYIFIASFVLGIFIGYALYLLFPAKKKEQLDETIDELGKEIVLLEDIDKISFTIKSILAKHLDINRISIVIYDDNLGKYRITDSEEEYDFTKYLPFFYKLEIKDRVILINEYIRDTTVDKKVLEAARDYFKDLQVKVAVPLIFERRLIGIINLDRKRSGKEYSNSDFNFLNKLRREMTVAFTNSLLFNRMSQMFEDVEVQNEKLKEMDKAKSSFWANVSHDLKTPISTIKNYVEHLLTTGKLTPQEETNLNEAFINIKKMERLITSLLTYSQMETGKIILHKENTNIKDIILESLEEVHPDAKKKGLNLLKNLQDVYTEVDITRIMHVMMNLLDNAIKYTDKGVIEVVSKNLGDKCIIKVMDKGIGIPQEKQKQVFESFIHIDPMERKYSGIGLGLPISKALVEMHGGKIILNSDVGKGTTVIIELPAATPPQQIKYGPISDT